MITHIHHLNILVRDLDKASAYWSGVLEQSPILEPLAGRGVTTARFQIGQTWLVLVSPESESSVLWPLLVSKGEGLFLLSLGTGDLTQALDRLAKQDINPASDPRSGLAHWQVCDIDADAMGEHILQLCQDPDAK